MAAKKPEEKEAQKGERQPLPQTLAGRIAAVMGEVKRLEKTGFNSYFKYKFVTAEDVKDLIRPLLAKYGIAIFPAMGEVSQESRVNDRGKTKFYTRLKLTYTVVATDTGESRELPWESESQDDEDKGINKALTAALKNFLINLFQVSTGDEADIEEVPVIHSDLAAPVLLDQIIVMYRAARPDDKRNNNAVLEHVFDKACGEGADYTQENAGRVLVALARIKRPNPSQEPPSEAEPQEEAAEEPQEGEEEDTEE